MRYGKDDVVAHLRLHLRSPSVADALHRCSSLMDELGVVGVAAEPIGPEAYLTKLIIVEASEDEETSTDALRRVAVPLLSRLGLGGEYFETDESTRRTVVAAVYYPEHAAKLLPGCEQIVVGVWMGDSVDDFYDTVESLDVDEEAQPQLDETDLVEVAQLVRQVNATKILLVADIVAADGVAARDHIRSVVVRACAEPLVGEPIPGPDGRIRVEVMVGMSDDGPDEAYREVVDKLDLSGWEVVERSPTLVRAAWCSPRPDTGVTRMELRIGPNVGAGWATTPAGS